MRHLPLCALAALALLPANVSAQKKAEPLVEKVRQSIDKAVEYLRLKQEPDGGWEKVESGREIVVKALSFKGGGTSLALLALINAGVPTTDRAVSKGLEFLKNLKGVDTVYSVSLQTMVFAEAYQLEGDKARKAVWQEAMRKNVNWLLGTRRGTGKDFLGWSYGERPIISDNSNTQFALLALWMAAQAGVDIPAADWRAIQDYYIRTQNKERGTWGYMHNTPDASMTMTTAGLSGLIIASLQLNEACEKAARPGMASRRCGLYADAEPVARATQWIAEKFTIQFAPKTFYHLYGLERAGRLTGERFIGDHDWYREGCEYLTTPGMQKRDGSYVLGDVYDQWPLVSTSFALLFLSKGRTPVLISKMVHFNRERGDDRDWNNDRNDLRHLVPFCGEQLFKGAPLGWQSFDVQRPLDAIQRRRIVTDDDIADIAAELMQSPVLYITGHERPDFRFTQLEKKVLARYVDSGGFIFAEACCDNPAFDAGFKKLVADELLWPDNDLSPLDGKHPVWSSHFLVKPDDVYPLYGISRGCKTILIYSPRDMSCFWEKNLQDDRTGRGHLAFRLGANVVAYATGKEPPKPRLTPVDVVRLKEEPLVAPRGHLQVAQVYHTGDWNPAKNAMRNLMDHVNRHAGLDVVRTTKKVQVDTADLKKYKFFYMQGRAAFNFDEEDLKDFHFNLTKGGALLFADASCGKEAFDKAFRAFVKQLFPDRELERVPVNDLLFSSKVSGIDLNETNIRGRIKSGEDPRPMAPYLEGIKIDGRWAVLYSKYDIGCALERHSTSDCLAYTPESAYRIAMAAVLYTYWPFPKEK